jgi:hypothetical protein
MSLPGNHGINQHDDLSGMHQGPRTAIPAAAESGSDYVDRTGNLGVDSGSGVAGNYDSETAGVLGARFPVFGDDDNIGVV